MAWHCIARHKAQEPAVQPTIEVTASRVAETVDASLADVSVITRADIDASVAPDLIELLRLQAGIDVVRTGGAGQQTSVFLRGTNSNHVLVLIDGVRVASANTGAFAFENLPLDAIERVEIVRGPRASYWGSDAIGGVIQIFTRQLEATRLAASYGTLRSADGSAGIGAEVRRGRFQRAGRCASRRRFFDANPNPATAGRSVLIYNPDDNGFRITISWRKVITGCGTQMLSATLFRSEGTSEFRQRRLPAHGSFDHPRSGRSA